MRRPRSNEPYDLVLGVLRVVKKLRQNELERIAGLKHGAVTKLESGRRRLNRRQCEELAVVMGHRRSAVDEALAFVSKLTADASGSHPGEEAVDEIQRSKDAFVATMAKAAGDFSRAWDELFELQAQILEAKRRALVLRARLLARTDDERLALVKELPEFQDWGLCVLLCEDSEAAAPESAVEARAIAKLAIEVARHAPGDPGWRARLEGYALARLSNALRVGGNLRAADEAFTRALRLWEAGASSDPGFLDGVRMLDLEASLRKDQRRNQEALDLLDRALATRPGAEVEGRLLINKACALENLERYEDTLAALQRAAPLVDGTADARLQLVVRFDVLVNLCHLGRHTEAEAGLDDVRERAAGLGKALDGIRVTWLEGRVAAGLGRMDEALAAFERVREELTERRMAYDTALVILDLAVLLAERGRTEEVKRLAQEAAWIFETQGVHREALRALDVFRRVAREGRLTIPLVRRIAGYLVRARHDPELRFTEAAA